MSQHDTRDAELIDQLLLRIRSHCEANTGRLDGPQLERLADILLRIVGDDPEYPIREALDHHTQVIHSLDAPDDFIAENAHARPAVPTGPSLQALIARLLVSANIASRAQREVARLYLFGHSSVEIAELLSVPRTTVLSRWRRARKHLQRALKEVALEDRMCGPSRDGKISDEGVLIVFRADQQRGGYRPPRHCPDGRERCATTGICPFRGPVE